MDFSPWNWAASFRLHEAACLIAGVMPISKRQPTSEELPPQARPPLLKLASAYYEWFLQAKNPERPKSIVLEGVLNEDGSLPAVPALNAVSGEIVSRAAIHKFLALMAVQGLKSCYDFGPIDKACSPLGIPHQPRTTPLVSVESASTPTPAPVRPETAQQSKELLPLTTGDIAFCFDGIRWTEQQWRKPLGDKPKWLKSCIAIPGVRGVSETRWNPILIAAALVNSGHTNARSVRAKFQKKPLLLPWLDAWKTYEADYLDSD